MTQLGDLARAMLVVHERMASARSPDEMTRAKRQIDATGRQIDQMVYELYGVTDAEIAVVEAEAR